MYFLEEKVFRIHRSELKHLDLEKVFKILEASFFMNASPLLALLRCDSCDCIGIV